MVLARIRLGVACLAAVLCAAAASAQTPTLTGGANGSAISLTWTAVQGATGYDVMVQAGNTILPPIPVGNVLAVNVPGVPQGTYLVAVRATAAGQAGPLSNVLTIAVTGVPVAPPAAPANLSATVNGLSVLLTWDLAATSELTGLVVQAGTSEGGSDLVTQLIRVSTSTFLGTVPQGNYFLRLFAVNAGGLSPASNELNLVVPGCVAPASIPFTVTSNGGFVQASWPQIPGATGYRLDASSTPGGGPDLASAPFPATQTSFSLFGVGTGTYYLTLHATLSCGVSTASAEQVLNVTAPVRQPAKGFSEATGMVLAAARATPGIGSSCGNTTWLFGVLSRLRQQDDRFGNNWKRGNVGDMSQDVILYNFTDVPNEQAHAAHVYAWDVIGGHCGPNPSAQANNITDARGAAGWTILKYLQAGFAP